MRSPQHRKRHAAIVVGLLFAAASSSCQKAGDRAAGNADPAQVLAVVGGAPITVADLEQRINGQSPFARGRYTTADKKKELLQEVVRGEVMADEARRRGYDKDPEVVRAMEQQMIAKLMEKDFEAKHTPNEVPRGDVERYYQEHQDEFNKNDEVLIGEIVVKDKTNADKVYAEAKALPHTAGVDQKAFHDLVMRYSEDEPSKQENGVLPFFDERTTAQPRAIVEASFGLKSVGEVSTPVQTEKGWAILKLLQKRPGYDHPLAEVEPQIRQRLFRDLRAKALDAFVTDLEKKSSIVLHEENLSKVVIGAPSGSAGTGGMRASLPTLR